MNKNTITTAVLSLSVLGMLQTAAHAQTSYKGWNPRWSVLSEDVSRATSSAQRSSLVRRVENGSIDTRGTRVNVNNSAIERTATGRRSPFSNSNLKFHNPLGPAYNNPTSSRWYQRDGNTQIFRVFPQDQNMYGTRVGAGRSEAFANRHSTRLSDGKTMTFSGRFHVAGHNGSKDVKIFQSKANGSTAWGVAIWALKNGDIVIVQRMPSGVPRIITDTNKNVGQSFNLRVSDDGLNYRVYIDGRRRVTGSWDRGNDISVCRWGAYVQGGTAGVLTGSLNNPQVVYVSGARVELN